MRIGVYCPNWVGDAVMSIPFFNAIRQQHPDDKIFAICKSSVEPIFKNHSAINEIISFQNKDLYGIRANRNSGRSLKAMDLDVFYLLSNTYRSAYLAKKSKTPMRIGYPGQWRTAMLTDVVDRSKEKMHRYKKYLKLLMNQNIDFKSMLNPGIIISKEEKKWARTTLSKLGIHEFIALFPFSVATSRSLPKQKILELLEKTHESIIIFGGKGDKYNGEILVGTSKRRNIHSLAGLYNLRQSMALISQSKGAIASDSGLGHISGNLGIPTVTLFGAGDAAQTRPLGGQTHVINADVHCSPCLKNKCFNRNEPLLCLNEIKPKVVWKILSELGLSLQI